MLRQITFEGLASFFLVLTTFLVTNSMTKKLFTDQHFSRAFVIGCQYAIYYCVGKRISGGVVNPSVSLGLGFTKKLNMVEVS